MLSPLETLPTIVKEVDELLNVSVSKMGLMLLVTRETVEDEPTTLPKVAVSCAAPGAPGMHTPPQLFTSFQTPTAPPPDQVPVQAYPAIGSAVSNVVAKAFFHMDIEDLPISPCNHVRFIIKEISLHSRLA